MTTQLAGVGKVKGAVDATPTPTVTTTTTTTIVTVQLPLLFVVVAEFQKTCHVIDGGDVCKQTFNQGGGGGCFPTFPFFPPPFFPTHT